MTGLDDVALLYVALGLWEGFRRGFFWSLGRLLGGAVGAVLAIKESGQAIAYLRDRWLGALPAFPTLSGVPGWGALEFWLWMAMVLGGLEVFMRLGGSLLSRFSLRPGPVSRLLGSLLGGLVQLGLAALIVGGLLEIPYTAPFAKESLWVKSMPRLFEGVEKLWSFWREASLTP
ncbi:MAG: CvpA family protein [Clostridiales bacterium]|nr:CvpA family protein [Clostridiales bacterium]